MSTQRSQIIAAVTAALSSSGRPSGLLVTGKITTSIEQEDLPRMVVSRVKEITIKAFPNQLRSPLVERHLTVRLDVWVTPASPATDAEEALEPFLAWGTAAMMADPSWSGLALETTEDSTEWELADDAEVSIGHAWMDFTIRFPTKTADQEQRQ